MLQGRLFVVGACLCAAIASGVGRAEEPPIQIDADSMIARGENEPAGGPDIVAEGHVLVSRRDLKLRAPRLEVDRATRTGVLSGGVVGVDGLVVFAASRLRFDWAAGTQTLEEGTVLVKKDVTEAELSEGVQSEDPGCVRTKGKNALTLKAKEIRRNPNGELDATGLWFTNCACGENCTPLLSVSASHSHIVPGDRATFLWPMLRLFDVPVLPLPWISLPLSSRQTGLLFPIVGFNGPGGINVGLPVFVTLGLSADMTLEPLYFFGTSNADNGGHSPESVGVRGPAGDFEWRWRPAIDAMGAAHVLYLFDTSKADVGNGPRGSRGLLDASHAQGLLGGRLSASINVASDSDVPVDVLVPAPLRYQEYLRSSVQYSRPVGPFGLSLESLYIEDLASQPCAQNQTCFPRTPLWQIPGVVAPVARLDFGGATVLSRLFMSEHLTLAAEDTWPGLPPPVNGHSRRLTAGLALAQTLPLLGGEYGTLSLDAGERGQFLALPGQQDWRAGGYLGLLARTRIARTFSSGLVHDIVPSLRVRALDGLGSLPYSRGVDAAVLGQAGTELPQSDWDLALPPQATVQAVASISTGLAPPGAPPFVFSVEEHLALLPFDAGQIRLGLDAPFGPNLIRAWGGRVFSNGLQGWGPSGVEYDRAFADRGNLVLRFSYDNGRTNDQLGRSPDLLFTPRFEIPPSLNGTQSSYKAHAEVTLRQLGPFQLFLGGELTYYPNATKYLDQDYKVVVSYAAEGCGVVKLSIGWTWSAQHGVHQPFPLPGPSPEYLPGNSEDISRGVASVLAGD